MIIKLFMRLKKGCKFFLINKASMKALLREPANIFQNKIFPPDKLKRAELRKERQIMGHAMRDS